MTVTHRRTARLAPLLAAPLLALTVPLPSPAAAQAVAPTTALADPAGAALDWIEGELADDGGHLTSSYDAGGGSVGSFDDWGLTIDAVLALAAGGRGGDAPATTATAQAEAEVAGYVTGFSDDRYAGALAKALLLAEVQGQDATAFGGVDLVAELRARLQTSGPDAGRFSDLSAYGDFSNGFGQALAILGLARAGTVPESAVAFLEDQQCPGGGFRGDYTTSGGCTADAQATVDATAFALQALTVVDPTCDVRQAVADGVAWLIAGQGASGAFGGDTGSNTNSTGLAAVVLRFLGQPAAADRAAAFIAGLQVPAGDETGAIALNQAGFDSAADGIQVLERDGFRRAGTQGVLAFEALPYGQIGTTPIDPTDDTPCAPEEPPPAPTASLSARSVAPGGQLTVAGTGFEPGEPVAVTLHSAPVDLGTTTADELGRVSFTFTVPADLEPGQHRIELVGQRSGVRVSAIFEIEAVVVPQTLPATGRATGAQAASGALLVLVGAGLVAASRPRRRAAGTAPT